MRDQDDHQALQLSQRTAGNTTGPHPQFGAKVVILKYQSQTSVSFAEVI
jgi:hypothetical protein